MKYQSIKEMIYYLPKSKIKAGDGLEKGLYPFFTSSPIQNKYYNEYLYNDECLIIGTGGQASVHYYHGKFSTSTDNFVFKVDGYNMRFVYYYLLSNIHLLENKFKGAGLKHISKDGLESIKLPIVNKNKQNEICEIMDKISSQINIKTTELDKFDQLVKSEFVEMFGDPISNDKKWNYTVLSDVAPLQSYKGDFNDKVWLLNLDMIESNSGKIIDYVYEDKLKIGNSTCTFNEDNILYSKLRPYLNKVVIPEMKGYATSELIPLKPKQEVLNKYFLAYLLRSKYFVDYISAKVAGAKMPRVSMGFFKNFQLILPPIELQNKFANIVKQIDKQKLKIEKQLEKLQELQKSLMKEYFK